MKRKKLGEISKKLVSNGENYMSSFRSNIRTYMKEADIKLDELSEEANIPYDTFKSFLYGDSKDCKLSTAIKLAKALNVSIDELVGCETIAEITRKNIATCRNLPANSRYLIRWYVEHQRLITENLTHGKRILSVMEPECNNSGNLKMQEIYKYIDITHLEPNLRGKVFLGMKIPCEHYMPLYSPYDILLIANDRPAIGNEHIVIHNDKCLFIVIRKVEKGVAKLYGIRDGKYRMDEKDVDEIIGYVADVITGEVY